ncbi:MAG: hypothetical protein JWM41_4068 [Gemmatimonadetes bacterium]|nr:hypothetical protein [Gemmatimonadota bacterium]
MSANPVQARDRSEGYARPSACLSKTTMQLLAECSIAYGATTKSLQLLHGDLASLAVADAVDCLVVSAFPGDYAPTPTSLIGALVRRGMSVQRLASEKEQDLRESFSCWISKDLGPEFPTVGFRRLLCFERLVRGNPAELTMDIFSALMPFVLGDTPIRSVAMPVVASGDQKFDQVAMFESLFRAAVWWLGNGMPLDTVKIVVHSETMAHRLEAVFHTLQDEIAGVTGRPSNISDRRDAEFDYFISYSHDDTNAVDQLMNALVEAAPRVRVFRDRISISAGASWQSRIDEAIECSRKIIALYSPSYVQSRMCKEEFNLARIRHRESNDSVLVPIYLRSANVPLYMRSINYIDCRESDTARIRSCVRTLCSARLERIEPGRKYLT